MSDGLPDAQLPTSVKAPKTISCYYTMLNTTSKNNINSSNKTENVPLLPVLLQRSSKL